MAQITFDTNKKYILFIKSGPKPISQVAFVGAEVAAVLLGLAEHHFTSDWAIREDGEDGRLMARSKNWPNEV